MKSPSQTISSIKAQLPDGVQLVAVSKYHPSCLIREAYEGGQRIFGESQVQELTKKYEELPKDIEWHFIGHLQTNKVKYIAPFVSLIHAVDSPRLMAEIDKQAARCRRTIPVLLQLHVAKEETKFGFAPEELLDWMAEGSWRQFEHVEIAGLMCIASNTDDEARIAADFALAEQMFRQIKATYFAESDAFCRRSWGMSGDYPIAIRHGSTLIRVGSMIFGERDYSHT